MIKRFWLIFFITIISPAFADYTITYLGSFNEPFTYSRPLGVNNSGQVVGVSTNASNQDRAFLWDSINGIQDIGDLGGGACMATGINDAGQVVGSSRDSSGVFRPFVWDGLNGMQSFSDISSDSFIGAKINNNSQVVGGFYDSSGWSQAFYWDNVNGTQLLGNLNQDPYYADYSQSEASHINNNGYAVGWADDTLNNDRAFLWDSVNGMQNLGSLGTSGGNYSWAHSINDNCQVVGSSGRQAFEWDSINGMQGLGTLGGSYGSAYDINNHGQIVGTSDNVLNQDRATLWENGVAINLNDYLLDDSDFFLLTEALHINDNGQIVGLGYRKNGFEGMFIMTPIPEPTTCGLLGLGVGMIWLRKRKL